MDFVLTVPLAAAAFELNPLDAAVGVPAASASFEINPLSVDAQLPAAPLSWSIAEPGVLDAPLAAPFPAVSLTILPPGEVNFDFLVPGAKPAFEIVSPGELSISGNLPAAAAAFEFANDGFVVAAELPELAAEITGVPYVTLDFAPPRPDFSLVIYSAQAVDFALSTPPLAAAWDIGGFDFSLPSAGISFDIVSHGAFSADARAPSAGVAFSIASSASPISIDAELPTAQAALGISSTSLTVVISSPLPVAYLGIGSGSALSIAIELDAPSVRLDVGASVPMSFAIELPGARGEFFAGAPVSTTASAYWAGAMNARNFGVTEYTGFAFNSFAVFAGKQIAAGAGGLFELGGATDAGTAIDADVVSGRTNFGVLYKSRISRIYVTVATSGAGEVVTVTPFDGRRAYAIPSPQTDDTQQRFVRIGRGVKSHAWQVGYSNREGADFVLYGVDPRPEFTYRRAA